MTQHGFARDSGVKTAASWCWIPGLNGTGLELTLRLLNAGDQALAAFDTRDEQNRTPGLGCATDKNENISRDHCNHAFGASLGGSAGNSGTGYA